MLRVCLFCFWRVGGLGFGSILHCRYADTKLLILYWVAKHREFRGEPKPSNPNFPCNIDPYMAPIGELEPWPLKDTPHIQSLEHEILKPCTVITEPYTPQANTTLPRLSLHKHKPKLHYTGLMYTLNHEALTPTP